MDFTDSNGDQGEKGIPSPQMAQKSLDLSGHKRKASQEIGPTCESDNGEKDPSNNNSQQVSLPSILALLRTTEQQADAEMIPQEGGNNEKLKGGKDMPYGGPESDLNKKVSEVENGAKVEPDFVKDIQVEPHDSQNIGVKSSEIEKIGVESHALNIEVEPVAENIDGGGIEKVEKVNGIPHGRLVFDLNKEAKEISYLPKDMEEEKKVESDIIANTEIDTGVVAENIEVTPSALETVEVKPSSVENKDLHMVDEIGVECYCVVNKEMEFFPDDEIEDEPDVVEKNEGEPSSGANKIEVESCAEVKNEGATFAVDDKIEVKHCVVVNNEAVEPAVADKVEAKEHEAGPSTASINEVGTSLPAEKIVFPFDLNVALPDDYEDDA